MSYVSSILFFFSSRRRHTRSKRDWSSDVCSSDLRFEPPPLKSSEVIAMPTEREAIFLRRSEERRVGKECRFRRWLQDSIKTSRSYGLMPILLSQLLMFRHTPTAIRCLTCPDWLRR